MRIQSVRIKNFRCLEDVRIEFDSVTAFIGPNGAGKSTVLRALNWFFNGEPSKLTDEDVYSGAHPDNQQIVVEVTFTDLSERDRSELGEKYAPVGSTAFTAWRTWACGVDKMTGKARAFPPFEAIRGTAAAKDKKPLYEGIREELELPKWTTMDAAEQAMKLWEQSHPDRLEEAIVDTTHLFGFNGQNKLSGLFDYVLVTADLRASEESVEGRKTIVGRILERTVSREGANAEFEALAIEVSARQAEITTQHLSGQLDDLGAALTAEVGAFTSGRSVRLRASSQDVRSSPATISVSIEDALVETSVDRQGHGFQRALLISSLKLLASRGAPEEDGSVILLAIEEPELFQHPTQARVFARVLRELAEAGNGGMQVAYATHSPFFVDAKYFDQIRRVTRGRSDGAAHPSVEVFEASMDAVAGRVKGFVTDAALRSRWDQVCTKHLAEALFADAVVLVEGEDDKGILDGIAARPGQRQFEADGVTVAFANGKRHLFIPHAILTELHIPTLTVFDNDKGCGERMRSDGKAEHDANVADEQHIKTNRGLMRYFDLPEVDYPAGAVDPTVHVWDDDLERVLAQNWPGWEAARQAIVSEGRGAKGKNAATYTLTSRQCPDDPSGTLIDVVAAARALVSRDMPFGDLTPVDGPETVPAPKLVMKA